MSQYAPIVGLIVLAAVFAAGSMVLSTMVGPKRYNRVKADSYECGIEPTPQPTGGGRFPIKYYLTAMTFIIFDIEIVFLYPWAVQFEHLGAFGFFAIVTFLVLISVPFAYEWRRGGLEWD